MKTKFILLIVFVFLPPLPCLAEETLFSLSFKELLNVPDVPAPQGIGIFLAENSKVTKDSINFGLLVPVTGRPVYAAELIAGADLAAQEINNAGGINGKELVIIRADNVFSPQRSVELAKTLISTYSVTAIIGPSTSDSTSAVLKEVTIPKGIPLVTIAASADEIGSIDNNQLFWRMVANNQQQVTYLLEKLTSQNRHKNVYFIGDRGLYTNEIVAGLKKGLSALGHKHLGELRISSQVDLDRIDLDEELSAIQELQPSAVILSFGPTLSIPILKKMNHIWKGKLPLILAGDTIINKDLKNNPLGKIKNCVQYLISTDPIKKNRVLEDKVDELLEVKTTGRDSTFAYDAVMLFAMAKQIESTSQTNFKQALSSITSDGPSISYLNYSQLNAIFNQNKKLSYIGPSGRVKFDQQGNNLAAVMTLQNIETSNDSVPSCLTPLH
jgi:branched-chain amino acid transport system substrate-binding protein